MKGICSASILLLFGILSACGSLHAQTVSGTVMGADAQPFEGAKVFWLETNQGQLSGSDGSFSLTRPDTGHFHVVVLAAGYQADTFCNDAPVHWEISLRPIQLEDVKIRDTRQGIYLDMDPRKTEVITRTELEKDACCDLAGCFNTQASVEARTTNVITNAKELQVLGLAGVYNQLLLDGLPLFRGTSYTYGIAGVPGPAVERIFVAKGAGSVLQGAESVTGQINVITLDPRNAEPLFFNVYANSFGEHQYNAHYAVKKKNWAALVSGHSAQPGMVIDRDQDGFRDVTWLRRYHGLAKLEYRDPDSIGLHGTLGLRFLNESRVGGQYENADQGATPPYLQSGRFFQPEAWAKLGFREDEKNKTSLNIAYQYHEQHAHFGYTHYIPKQNLLILNADHSIIWREQQQLKFGLSYRQLDLDERIFFSAPQPIKTYAGDYNTEERLPGAYAENISYFWKEKITLIAGVRADHHNQHGWFFSPRALLRVNPGRGFSARVSAGNSFRTVLLFTENIPLLASGRDIIFEETLQPERATNLGINADKQFYLTNAEGRVGVDAYHTIFQNQFFPDYDRDPGYAYIANFDGSSRGSGLQVETNWEFWKRFSVRVAYNYLDVYRVHHGERMDLPFISKHKLMGAFSIWSNGRRFHFDANAHWYGKQRLPDTEGHPAGFVLPAFSDPYFTLGAQAACKIDKAGVLDLYVGCENIFDFRQLRPIAGWQDPYSAYFDPAFVWGPTRGREAYMGIRVRPPMGR